MASLENLWGTSGDPTRTLEQLMAGQGFTSRQVGGEDERMQWGQMGDDGGWNPMRSDSETLANSQDTLNQQYHTPDGQFVRIGDRQLPVGQEQLAGLMGQAIDHPQYGRVVPVSAYNEAVKASYTGGSQLYLDPVMHAIAPNAYNPSMNAERLGDYGPQALAAAITAGGASGAFGGATVAAEGAAGASAGGGVTGGGLSAGGSSGLGLQAPAAVEGGLVSTGIGSGGAGSTSLAGGTSGLGLTGGGTGVPASVGGFWESVFAPGSGGGGNFPWRDVIGGGLGYLGSRRTARDLEQAGQQGAAAADPFAPQRPFFQDQLMQLWTDPNYLQNSPGYQAGVNSVNRRSAKLGQMFSGNNAADLVNYGSSKLLDMSNELGTLAGGKFGTSTAGNNITQGGIGSANARNQGLGNLGYMAAPFIERGANWLMGQV